MHKQIIGHRFFFEASNLGLHLFTTIACGDMGDITTLHSILVEMLGCLAIRLLSHLIIQEMQITEKTMSQDPIRQMDHLPPSVFIRKKNTSTSCTS